MCLVEWLQSLPDVRNVRPVKVAIGKETYEGAYYQQGRRMCFYLLGHLPKTYRKSSHECYTWTESPNEWYISSYTDANCFSEEFKHHHPFGYMFQVSPWDVSGKIDDYERRPYRRVPMAVKYLDTIPVSDRGETCDT